MNRVFGFILLAAGIVFLVLGLNASDSLGSEVKEFFTGNPTDEAVWFLVGAAVCGVAGLVVLMTRRRTA